MKIDYFHTKDSFLKLDPVLANLVQLLEEMRQCVNNFTEMDTFQGTSANYVKDYLEIVHGTIIDCLMLLIAELDTKLYMYMEEYHDKVDNHMISIIDTEHIENRMNDLNDLADTVADTNMQVLLELEEVSDLFNTNIDYMTSKRELEMGFTDIYDQMQQVINDFSSFDEYYAGNCSGMQEALVELTKLIQYGDSAFVCNTLYSEESAERDCSLGLLQKYMQEASNWVIANKDVVYDDILKATSNTLNVYCLAELFVELGISNQEYRMLKQLGIEISISKKDGKAYIRLISDELSVDEIKAVVRDMNLEKLAEGNLDRLVGDGLLISSKRTKIYAEQLVTELGNTEGFRFPIESAKNGSGANFSKFTKLGKAVKVIDYIGDAITILSCGVDNFYNPHTGRFESSEPGLDILDTITDSAIEIGGEEVIDAMLVLAGTKIGLVYGAIGGGVVAILGNLGLSYVKWGQPQKLCGSILEMVYLTVHMKYTIL